MNDIKTAKRLAKLVCEKGGKAYYVGGCVRDKLMGTECKDIDIEVHGILKSDLEQIIDTLGHRMEFGVSFGIYGIKGCGIDIALPRTERAKGSGHRDFDVTPDPFIGTKKAAMRRDFTINALMEDILTGEIIDHFGGIDDIKNKILRHVNENTFPEDPLRVLRAAQFAARFEFEISKETIQLCKSIDISTLSRERVELELIKALLKAKRPSLFFNAMRKMDQLSVWFPEAEKLIGIPQHKIYHMEGDVWDHTMMVLDEAAKYRSRVSYPYGFMMTALVHDFGKIICTEEKNGIYHAYGHETKGIDIVREFLRRITCEKKLVRYVLNMTELHMKPNVLAGSYSSLKATNKMFDSSVCPEDLIYFAKADNDGRITEEKSEFNERFLTERLDAYKSIMAEPYVAGKDLIDAGLVPDKNFSEILNYAHKLRLAGIKKESALKQTLSYAGKISK